MDFFYSDDIGLRLENNVFGPIWYSVFRLASVPSRIKMYETLATSDIHAVLHVAGKNSVYAIHLVYKINTLFLIVKSVFNSN
jgi:hypothetical protein